MEREHFGSRLRMTDPNDPGDSLLYRPALPIRGRATVVFGGSEAALKHVAAMLRGGARVTLVAPEASATLDDLADRSVITWNKREFEESDLDDAWLVAAATGLSTLDDRIEAACEDRRLWCVRERSSVREGGRTGQVVLVSGGPGDPGLLTVAGLEAIRAADVVVTDRLAPVAVLGDLPSDVEVVDVGKVPFGRATPQEEINRILVDHAKRGRNVVRLKGGDSFLFGRGGEELLACAEAGVPVSVIPGVTSALAVPALVGIPATHRGLTQGVTVVSGHVPPQSPASTIDYGALARSGTTLILLMAVRNLDAIVTELLEHGLPDDTPAATVANGTMPNQRIIRSALISIAHDVADAGIEPPAITVIGAVAGLPTRFWSGLSPVASG